MENLSIKQEKLPNGLLRLTAANGIVDIRNSNGELKIYCEADLIQ